MLLYAVTQRCGLPVSPILGCSHFLKVLVAAVVRAAQHTKIAC
jgi:hypothetical protein